MHMPGIYSTNTKHKDFSDTKLTFTLLSHLHGFCKGKEQSEQCVWL